MPFQVLHSSDWHLGKRLYHKSRECEFRLFLDWLLQQLPSIDLLLIAGDVFDTNSPPVWAQELYYQFLHRASHHCQIVVCAGNHDSALFLEAPRSLLKALRIHVVGQPSPILRLKVENYLAEQNRLNKQNRQTQEHTEPDPFPDFPPELVPIANASGSLAALVCILPYLKDSELRNSSWDESQHDKEKKIQQGIAAYYQVMRDEALRFLQQQEVTQHIPLIATGHLFASGASTHQNDGVRELYIGSLGHFPSQLFPPEFDYVALGHIHQAQILKATRPGQELRYSGAPLSLSFNEQSNEQGKVVLKLSFDLESNTKQKTVEKLSVPQWQRLVQLRGSAAELEQGLVLAETESQAEPQIEGNIWLDIDHSGDLAESIGLREKLSKLAQRHNMEILHYSSRSLLEQGLSGQNPAMLGASAAPARILSELSPEEVFRQRLKQQSAAAEPERPQNQSKALQGELAGVQAESQITAQEPQEHAVSAAEDMEALSESLWPLYRSLLEQIALQKTAETTEQNQADEGVLL